MEVLDKNRQGYKETSLCGYVDACLMEIIDTNGLGLTRCCWIYRSLFVWIWTDGYIEASVYRNGQVVLDIVKALNGNVESIGYIKISLCMDVSGYVGYMELCVNGCYV